MSKKQQVEKNLKLSEKLATFVAENPNLLEDLPSHASFVVFSSRDTALNKKNKELLKSLLKEGKKIVKVNETGDKNNPWKFTTISS